MFEAEKQFLEIALNGLKIGRYTHQQYSADTESIWYVYGPVAFRPVDDFMLSDQINRKEHKPFFPVLSRVLSRYQQDEHYMMTSLPAIKHKDEKLVPFQSNGEKKLLTYVPWYNVKPWLNKKHRFVFVPPEASWGNGMLLILNNCNDFPVAMINVYRKEE